MKRKSKLLVSTLITGFIIGGVTGLFLSSKLKIENISEAQNLGYSESFPSEEATIKVAQSVGKSVVSISTIATEKIPMGGFYFSPFGEDDFFRRFFEEFFDPFSEKEYKRMGLGSGVIIDSEGYILTNEHVISGAEKIKVTLSDGREFDAKVIGKDYRSDLAVIKIDAHNLPVVKLGDSDTLKIGQWVLAIGNPFGFAIENPEPTVTFGVISALHRDLPRLGKRRAYYDLIQTDAAINPGNSGGPLVNLKGEIIGINVAIITTTGAYEGIGFAIPVNLAKKILRKLIKGEKILYGWLGVSIQNLNKKLADYFGLKDTKGALVVKVFKDSPAQRAGIKEKDVILEFDNKPVNNVRDLVRYVNMTEPGKKVKIKILRKKKYLTLEVKIGKRPENTEKLEEIKKGVWRGLEVDDIISQNMRKFGIEEGVVVVYVEPNSPADEAGLEKGDVILEVEGQAVHSKEDFFEKVKRLKGDVLIKTNRGYFVVPSK